MKQITHLSSGGLITNYYCTSQCRHCLYACSPKWPKQYIDSQTVEDNIKKILELGCYSIHIGGGEPFLDENELLRVVKIADKMNMGIEYIETNSSWYQDENKAVDLLEKLKACNIRTLLVSISPFHNEYIPFKKVKSVIDVCQRVGISIFPWIQDFYGEIDSLDDSITHSLEEYTDMFGSSYVSDIPSRYWIHYGGRSIETFQECFPLKQTDNIINNSSPCEELTDTSHFHMDLFGRYIPGLCSGLAIQRDDLGESLDRKKYPIISCLYDTGIGGLLDMVKKKFDYSPKDKYLSKCHLCLDIRCYLVKETNIETEELQPEEYYLNL